MIKVIKTTLIFLLAIASFQNCFAQFDIPEKPTFQTSVYDYIDLLSNTEKINLEQKLIRYSDTTSTQIVVAIISSTEGENINYLGANWGEKWRIGQEKEDNGILIIILLYTALLRGKLNPLKAEIIPKSHPSVLIHPILSTPTIIIKLLFNILRFSRIY